MLQKAFDTYAKNYDDHFSFSLIGKMQRERVQHYLKPYLKTTQTILEINCGTGVDALFFANKNHTVIATDISESMIEVAQQKIATDNSIFMRCDMRSLNQLSIPKSTLVFSNFGGLNCLNKDELQQLSIDINMHLQPNGLAYFVVMGRKCVWENFYFKWIKHKGYKRRENINGVATEINNEQFTTYYYSPAELKNRFSNHFSVVSIKPIGLSVPPSYLNYFFEKHSHLLKALYLLEKLVVRFSFMANYADHYAIVLQKANNQ